MLEDSIILHNECTDFVKKNKKVIDYVNEKLHGAKSEKKNEEEKNEEEKKMNEHDDFHETIIKYCLHFCISPFSIRHG